MKDKDSMNDRMLFLSFVRHKFHPIESFILKKKIIFYNINNSLIQILKYPFVLIDLVNKISR